MCHYLKKYHKIDVTVQELDSKERSLPSFVLDALEKGAEYFRDFEKYIKIIDHLSDPREIYNYMERVGFANGDVIFKEIKDDKGAVIRKIPIKYIPKNNKHILVIVDNLSNFDTEKTQEEREMMITFAKKYVRKWMCNFFRFSVIQVLQMSFDKERQQFTSNGMSIVSKLEPSLDGIGEAKVVARSMHLILGLFNPERYELMVYPNANGYNISILGDRFRAVKILKSNDCMPGYRVGLYFDAVPETFSELPLPADKEALEKVYNHCKTLNGQKTIIQQLIE